MAMFGTGDIDALLDFDDQPQQLVAADVAGHYPADAGDFWRGGYGLFSTIDDYAAFLPVFATGLSREGVRLLSRKTVRTDVGEPHSAAYAAALYRADPVSRLRLRPCGKGDDRTGRGAWPDQHRRRRLGPVLPAPSFWIDRAEDISGIVMTQFTGSKIPLGDDIRNAVYQALDGD